MSKYYACHHEIVARSDAEIDLPAAMAFVEDPDFGGYAVFVGRVRQNNLGRRVTAISYDIFDALALTHFDSMITATRAAIEPRMKAYVAHAKGRLAVGDIAVVVAVGTPHRDEAFRACRQLIEDLKHQSPIWKQEHYVDGDSAWSEGCSLCETAHDQQTPHG